MPFFRRKSNSSTNSAPPPTETSFLDMSSDSGNSRFRLPRFSSGSKSSSSSSSGVGSFSSSSKPSLPPIRAALPEFYPSSASAGASGISRSRSPSVGSIRSMGSPAVSSPGPWISSPYTDPFRSDPAPRPNSIATSMPTYSGQQDERKARKPRRRLNPENCMCCNTSSTAEWRKGPAGLRTLCNAYGLVAAKSNLSPAKTLDEAMEQVEAIGRVRFRVGVFKLPEGARERAAMTFIPPEGGIDPSTVTLGPSPYSPLSARSNSSAASSSPSTAASMSPAPTATTPADVEAAMGLEALSRGPISRSPSQPGSAAGYPSISSPYSQPQAPRRLSTPSGFAADNNSYSYAQRQTNRYSRSGWVHPFAANASPFPDDEPDSSLPSRGQPAYSSAFRMPPPTSPIPDPPASNIPDRPSSRNSRRSSFSFNMSSSRPSTGTNFRFV